MSMFHELMMRKKEQIMYATIKGTLKENDGVISGFSPSNYLEIQGLYDCSQPFEVVLKIKTNVSYSSGFLNLANSDYGFFSALVGSGQHIGIWARNTDNNFIANGVYTPTNSVPNNTDKFVKFVFTGTQYIIALSDDGIIWNTTNTINNSTNIGTNITIKIGTTASSSQYFNGTIDLNRSYIKLGATKYNLQAVVGYTIVGSPTITDGVVSGFSDSDYLAFPTILSKYSSDDINRVEMGIKITTGNSVGLSGLIVNNNYYYNGLFIDIKIKLSFYFYLGGVDNAVSDVVLQPNTEYTIIGILDKKTNSIKISVNGIVNTNIANYFTFLNNQATGIGYGYRTDAFKGSIDLKSTYIKVNNKLYFNGQQA